LGALTTARATSSGEHQKARYRVLVTVIIALFGPPAFGIELGALSVVYSICLVLYSLWALRLTVLFFDDRGLGYLLTLFDVAMTLPLVIWGTEPRLAAPVALLWVTGLSTSALIQRGHPREAHRHEALMDASSGLGSPGRLAAAVESEARAAGERSQPFGLLVVRVHRLGELKACHGPAAGERAFAALARRALRSLGAEAEGYRLADDRFAVLVPGCTPRAANEVALDVSRNLSNRLLEGRRIDCLVGVATYPRDGASADQLLHAAERSGLTRILPEQSRPKSAARPVAAAG
jgi:GGDEF domain-containing protein